MKTTESQPLSRPDALRRKLFRGAAGGVGVLLAVQAKTALGSGTCQSPSAKMSGNLSHHNHQSGCFGGRSPGYWKQQQHFNSWVGTIPPTFNANVNEDSLKWEDYSSSISNPGTLLNEVFTGAKLKGVADAPISISFWGAFLFKQEIDDGDLLFHLAAAWLNAGLTPPPETQYPLTRFEVQKMWVERTSYCPTNVTCSSTSRWGKQEIIDYIEGMYDLPHL